MSSDRESSEPERGNRRISLKDYRVVRKIGEGAFSEVMKVQSLRDGKFYACKCIKQRIDSLEKALSLREIQAMKILNPHPNILQLHHLVYDSDSGRLSLICELMEKNIYELIRGRKSLLAESKVILYMYQLCRSLDHMHSHGIFHRDVKPENILIRGSDLKLADLGSSRSVFSPPHTGYISTRWYRAPECLLTDGLYGRQMDLWSAGCVFYEMLSLKPLFPGRNALDQIHRIHQVLGTPDPDLLRNISPGVCFSPVRGSGLCSLLPLCSPSTLSLLEQLLIYNPEHRISARAALKHSCFRDMRIAERKPVGVRKPFTFSDRDSSAFPAAQQLWRMARNNRRQLKQYGDSFSRRVPPPHPVPPPVPLALPKLNVVIPSAKLPYPLPSITHTHRGALPSISNPHPPRNKRVEDSQRVKKSHHVPPLRRQTEQH
ncbi:hypothetical protein DNTS_030480 [Danionella cerebrum]|uniref:mitogen-activated protein kinase n=1 Tax=Danionella cerebrum TaxID=2873325 RepID=A0A553MM21_9TELE|nr:hypothetical protein DNTS_030480 [Danionella translucida]